MGWIRQVLKSDKEAIYEQSRTMLVTNTELQWNKRKQRRQEQCYCVSFFFYLERQRGIASVPKMDLLETLKGKHSLHKASFYKIAWPPVRFWYRDIVYLLPRPELHVCDMYAPPQLKLHSNKRQQPCRQRRRGLIHAQKRQWWNIFQPLFEASQPIHPTQALSLPSTSLPVAPA